MMLSMDSEPFASSRSKEFEDSRRLTLPFLPLLVDFR